MKFPFQQLRFANCLLVKQLFFSGASTVSSAHWFSFLVIGRAIHEHNGSRDAEFIFRCLKWTSALSWSDNRMVDWCWRVKGALQSQVGLVLQGIIWKKMPNKSSSFRKKQRSPALRLQPAQAHAHCVSSRKEDEGPVHTGRGAPCNTRVHAKQEHTAVNGSVHTKGLRANLCANLLSRPVWTGLKEFGQICGWQWFLVGIRGRLEKPLLSVDSRLILELTGMLTPYTTKSIYIPKDHKHQHRGCEHLHRNSPVTQAPGSFVQFDIYKDLKKISTAHTLQLRELQPAWLPVPFANSTEWTGKNSGLFCVTQTQRATQDTWLVSRQSETGYAVATSRLPLKNSGNASRRSGPISGWADRTGNSSVLRLFSHARVSATWTLCIINPRLLRRHLHWRRAQILWWYIYIYTCIWCELSHSQQRVPLACIAPWHPLQCGLGLTVSTTVENAKNSKVATFHWSNRNRI